MRDGTHDLVPEFSSVRHLEFGSLIRSRPIFRVILVEDVAFLRFLELVLFFRAINLCVCVVFLVMDDQVSRESFVIVDILNQRHLQFIGK